jgi:hypothetical protein
MDLFNFCLATGVKEEEEKFIATIFLFDSRPTAPCRTLIQRELHRRKLLQRKLSATFQMKKCLSTKTMRWKGKIVYKFNSMQAERRSSRVVELAKQEKHLVRSFT